MKTRELVKENRLNIPLHEHPYVCVLRVTYLSSVYYDTLPAVLSHLLWNETKMCVWHKYSSWFHVMRIVGPKGCHHKEHMLSHSSQYKRLRQNEVLFYQSLGPFTSAVVYISHTVFLYWWKYLSVDVLVLTFSKNTLVIFMYEIWPRLSFLLPNLCNVSASIFFLFSDFGFFPYFSLLH